MTGTQERTSDSPAATPRKRRRWLWIVAGVFVLLLLLVALAPVILSTGAGKTIILSQVNRHLNGRVEIADWSLGWFSGFRFNGIKVSDADGATVAEVRSVVVRASVPALLRANKKIGVVTVESPRANIVLYPDGTNNLTALLKETDPKEEKTGPLEIDVQAQLAVTNGELTIVPAQFSQPVVVHSLSVTAGVDSVNQPLPFEIKADLGEEKAGLEVKGTATLAKAGVIDPKAIEADVTVRLAGLELASVSDVARQFGSPVEVVGELNAAVKAVVTGMGAIKANGSVDVASLGLSGGPLGADTPKFDKADLSFDLALNGKKVEVTEFKVHSPVVDATASGTLDLTQPGRLPSGNLNSTITVPLAGLAAQFPNTLRLQEGIEIESGTLSFRSKLISDANRPRVESVIRLEGVEATRDGRRIGLKSPVSIELQAHQADGGIGLDKFELDSSFAQARGSGDMNEFDLDMTADLAAAVKEAAKFVDVGSKSVSGTAAVSVHVTSPEAQRKKLVLTAAVNDLVVEGIGLQPAALKEVQFTADALAELDEHNALRRITGVLATLSSPLAEVNVTADTIHLATGQALPVNLNNGQVTLKADLTKLAAFAHATALMSATTDARGALEVKAGVASDGGTVRIKGVEAMLKDLDLTRGDKHLREEEVRLIGREMTARLESRSLTVSDFAVAVSAGKVEIPLLEVPDWARKDATGMPSGMNAGINGTFDVPQSLETLKDFFQLPQGTNVAGAAKFTLKATAVQHAATAQLSISVDDFMLTQPGKPNIKDGHMTFDAVTVFNPKEDTLILNSVSFISTFLNLTAKAKLSDLTAAKRMAAEGTIEPDFDRIGPLAAAIIGQPIELSGKQSRPFKIDTALADADWRVIMRDTLANAGVFVARAKFLGIETGPIDIPVNVRDGKVQLKIDTTVNKGKLLLPAMLDVTGDVPVLTVPDKTRMLTDVEITNEMADLFLAKASPMFKGAVLAGGKVGLNVAILNAPLEADVAKKAAFEGELVFNGVRMQPGGFLLTILEAAHLGGVKGLEVPDQNVGVSLREGRFYQQPITFMADKYALRISGSVGLDTTLDMIAEVPVTPELLGKNKDLYALLKDESIKIPIKGTAAKPAVGIDILQANLASLLKAASTKLIKDKGTETILKGLQDILGGVKRNK